MSDEKIEQIKQALMAGRGVRAMARETEASTTMRIARSPTVEENHVEIVAA